MTVNGRDDENTPATATDSHSLTITNATPTITVDKTGPSTISEGSTATYNFAIHNTSPASTDPVTIDSVSDDILGDLTGAANAAWIAQGHTGPIVLAPGTGFTFSYTTLTVLGAGTYVNTVTVTGHDDESTTASDSDDHTLLVSNVAAVLTVDKSVTNINEGNTATYSYTITNASTASTDVITISSVSDDILGDLTLAAIAANGGSPIVLAPGESFSFNYATPSVLNAGTVVNVVTVTGLDDENTTTSATDTATLVVANVNPTLTIDKSAATSVVEGNTVTYTFEITNTSPASTDPVTITSIIDSVLGDLTPTGVAARAGLLIVLAPGESFTFTYTTAIQNAGVVNNTVTVTGRDDENTEATAQDSHTLTVTDATPTITVAKSAANINEGNTATYTFTIKNTSTASTDPVTISSVSDNVLGSLTADANAAWLAQGNTGASCWRRTRALPSRSRRGC